MNRKSIRPARQNFGHLGVPVDAQAVDLHALGVAARCDGCIGFHAETLVRLGATRQEVEETLGMAVYMGGGPSLMYAADAISAYEQFDRQLSVAA